MTNKELIKKMKLGSHLSRYQYLVHCLYSIVNSRITVLGFVLIYHKKHLQLFATFF